jgi:hypothetical protein
VPKERGVWERLALIERPNVGVVVAGQPGFYLS